ncbi:hypothetical protein [Mycoplasmopsis adleri]|uniref:hypothetical protein n=1 Tax=Mycoplasmopsis adleri TaxID=51362 RepID=UPI0038736D4C
MSKKSTSFNTAKGLIITSLIAKLISYIGWILLIVGLVKNKTDFVTSGGTIASSTLIVYCWLPIFYLKPPCSNRSKWFTVAGILVPGLFAYGSYLVWLDYDAAALNEENSEDFESSEIAEIDEKSPNNDENLEKKDQN